MQCSRVLLSRRVAVGVDVRDGVARVHGGDARVVRVARVQRLREARARRLRRLLRPLLRTRRIRRRLLVRLLLRLRLHLWRLRGLKLTFVHFHYAAEKIRNGTAKASSTLTNSPVSD